MKQTLHMVKTKYLVFELDLSPTIIKHVQKTQRLRVKWLQWKEGREGRGESGTFELELLLLGGPGLQLQEMEREVKKKEEVSEKESGQ